MKNIFKSPLIYVSLFAVSAFFTITFFSGCDDAGITNDKVENPNLKHYDSIWVEEDSSAGSLNGINLLDGVNCLGSYNLRDASLYGGQDSTGSNFYLRTGFLMDQLLDAGYVSRWFQVKSNSSQTDFDTLTVITDNVGTALDTADFTQESTEFWGYFNFPLTENPIYCFWLSGKKYGGLTNGKNVFGILRPVISSDSRPGQTYGFKIKFEVKLNTNGDNDFAHYH